MILRRGDTMKSTSTKLADWVRYSEQREREAFLSRAADHADLDRRIQIWEEREREFFNAGRSGCC